MSFFKHPSEFVANSMLSSLIAYPLLGLSPSQAGLLTAITAIAEFFYHWNVRTPRWVGVFIQRPEMHRIHHQRNRHTCNFADLPVIDMVFGTYRNPRAGEVECGFEPMQEQRFRSMLLCRDVHKRHSGETTWQHRDAA